MPQAIIFDIGSFPFKTYLKNADLDLTVLVGNVDEDTELSLLHAILQQLEFASLIRPQYDIKSLEIISAGVNVLKGELMSVRFDITINQAGASFSLEFLKMANRQFEGQYYKR